MQRTITLLSASKALTAGFCTYGLFAAYQKWGCGARTRCLSPSPDLCIQTLHQGKALVKIVRTGSKPKEDGNGVYNAWQELLKQLSDYNYRPAVRPKDEKFVNAKYKYVHLTGEIVELRSPEEKAASKAAKVYTHTKKLPVTYISENLQTDLFYAGHDFSHLTALIFDKDLCVIKGMFAEDIGSNGRQWYAADIESLIKYKKWMQSPVETRPGKFVPSLSYTHFESFKAMADNEDPPYPSLCINNHNEVLAKLTLSALRGILIMMETPAARKLARERRAEIKQKFNIDLPIVFYAPSRLMKNAKTRVYSQAEQEQDARDENKLREVERWHTP